MSKWKFTIPKGDRMSNSFPGDDQCETLKKIQQVISRLPRVSQANKNTAIEGIKMARKLLQCDD
jgi:hypothetical protein